MSTHPHIDRLCAAAAVLSLLLAILCMNLRVLGVQDADREIGYESRIFDTGTVHTIDIVMDDWDSFLETCENEAYSPCAVVIDGEAYRDVGIRAKGNTSLSNVSAMGSSRYSFKLEFDQYDSSGSYHGLDKLSLNNLIQDATFMKDYLVYRMMGLFQVAAPLCSYAYLTVNGEDWGLYLAVEGVEESFLRRNYGLDYGELYKPDSMDMGGGRGNGRDFAMDGFSPDADQSEADPFTSPLALPTSGQFQRGGMGQASGDVKLQYLGDDPASYSNIFENAKTDVSEADQARLISALEQLSAETDPPVDVDAVLRYFVVHNFVVNGDSYTGSMVHNYYLYEKDGQLSMIPWDYNLAFGGFQGGSASAAVNDPIDTPLSVTGSGDRPMIDWIFAHEDNIQLYHQYFSEFLNTIDISSLIDQAEALIAPYVERDPTKFYTAEEFAAGTAALRQFCQLRTESVLGQLDGTIPSTSSGQAADPAALVDTSQLSLSAMGSMGVGMEAMGGGGFPGQTPQENDGFVLPQMPNEQSEDGSTLPQMPSGQGEDGSAMPQMPGGQSEDGSTMPQMPDTGGTDGQADSPQMPGSGGGFRGTPPGMAGSRQGFDGQDPTGQEELSGGGPSSALLLGASALVLALGLLFAFRFKR